MAAKKLISREEVLGGLSGKSTKRATTLLTLIENHTAYLASQSQQSVEYIFGEYHPKTRTQAYLAAIAQGREVAAPITIQELERFAPQWAALVPDSSEIRATAIHLLARKYSFSAADTPQLQTVFGFDSSSVQQAYQRLYNQPLSTIFQARVQPLDRLRWLWTRLAGTLENLPPFWMACILTVVIGAVTLALPIAVAGIGPLPGVALIVIIGLFNMITIAAMSETVTRSGGIRFGNAFIGRVAADLLGNSSSALLSLVLAGFSFGLLLVFYIGISTTLEDATRLPAEAWMGLLFLIGLYFLSRGSINATVALTIVIGFVNLTLLMTLSLLAFTHFKMDNFLYVNIPFFNGQPFNSEIFGALIGVILGIYSSHILVAIFGKMLLQRDPDGRAVLQGHVAGIGVAMLINIIWVLAVTGAVSASALSGEASTSLVPLAAEIGPVMRILGAIFVIVSMGLGLIQFSVALFNLAQERLGGELAQKWGTRGRFLISLSPVVAVFLVAEWLSWTEQGSFAGLLGVLGVAVDSLMAGVFPVLLLVASRRKSEVVPGIIYRFLGHTWLVTLVYFLFLANIFFHALVIWQNPIQRLGGLVLGLVMLGLTLDVLRRRRFQPRTVVILRDDQRPGHSAQLSLVSNGQPLKGNVYLDYGSEQRQVQGAINNIETFATLRTISVELGVIPSGELKVWAYRLIPEGGSEPLSLSFEVRTDSDKQTFDLSASADAVVLPVTAGSCGLTITLNLS